MQVICFSTQYLLQFDLFHFSIELSLRLVMIYVLYYYKYIVCLSYR